MLGAKIFHYVQKSGLSVELFAGKLGITEAAAYKIFKKESIQTELLLRIAALLRLSINQLLEQETEDTNHSLLNEPLPTYLTATEHGELKALRELVLTQRELIEQLKTAGGAATNEKNPNQPAEYKKPTTA